MATKTTSTPVTREFVAKIADGSNLKLTVRLPNQKELASSETAAGLTFNEAVEQGLPVVQRVLRNLRRNGVITEQQEQETDLLRTKIRELNRRLADPDVSDELRQTLFTERNKAAADVGERNAELESYLQYTADAKAKAARETFQLVCVIQHAEDATYAGKSSKKGQRLWASVDDFEIEPDENLKARVTYEFFCLSNGIPADWLDGADAPMDAETASPEPEADTNVAVETKQPETLVHAD